MPMIKERPSTRAKPASENRQELAACSMVPRGLAVPCRMVALPQTPARGEFEALWIERSERPALPE
jgi:hypothetical protein